MKTLSRWVLLLALLSGSQLQAQIVVNGGLTAQQLAENLSGPNIVVTNAQLTGSPLAAGLFSGTSNLGFNSGVILCTGPITQAPGPNNSAGNAAGGNLNQAGTAQMTALGGATSHDAVTLEFDFQVQSSSVQFDYVFASEEYPEYAPPNSSSYNDVFAFYISGPGITGEENIALVPNTTSAVSINNINPITNSAYYVNNAGGATIQFDGFTTQLTAKKLGLTPCQNYHLKLVIADIGDYVYNSGVFLKESSLVQGTLNVETQTVNADGVALEGCIKGRFEFEYSTVSNVDRTVNFTIGGTAVNGVDYTHLDNYLVIPAGETTGTIYIDAISDGLTEGAETVTITFNTGPCSGTQTVTLTINDAQPIDFSLDGENLDCFEDNSGEIAVNATGGFPAYTYLVTNPNGQTTPYTTNPITGLAAGTYSVQVSDSYGCKAKALVIGGQFNAGTTFLPDGSGVTYDAPLTISGFNPGQTINNLSQIQQICLTMEHSYLGDLHITVESPSGQIITLKDGSSGASCDLGEPIASGPVDGAGSSDITPGIGYEYCFNANPFYGTMGLESANYTRNYTDGVGNSYTDYYLPAGSYMSSDPFSGLLGSTMNGTWKVHVTDQFGLDNGYIFNWYISLVGDLPDTVVVLSQPTGITISGMSTNATCGQNNGSVNISSMNGVAPMTYAWSNGATTEDLVNVGAGVYTVTATDANGCSVSATYTVNNTSSLQVNSTVTPVHCNGASTGAIATTTTGGTLPYAYSWSSGPTTPNLNNLAAGSYTLTVTDGQNCQYSTVVAVPQNDAILVTSNSVQDEVCSQDNGAINVQVSGGNGSYGYSWNNGATTEDLSQINAGSYTLTVTDGYGCTGTGTFAVINNLSNCSNFCYLAVQEQQHTNAYCGASNGAISVDILNGASPLQVNWSNGSTATSLTGLAAGTYTITVTDANACTTTENYTIVNQTNGLTISSNTLTPETCGNDNGAVNITVSGGTGTIAYNWSNGATSEDITQLSAGVYTVTLTDGGGCSYTQSFTVANDPGSLAVNGQVVAAMCSQANGSVNQTVTGANGVVSFQWSNSAVTEDIVNLTYGTYSCTVTDGLGCSVTNNYTVPQNSGNIAIQGVLLTNEMCNNNGGAIQLTTSGNGLSYLWSNGAVTEDLTGLNAGNYTCVITNTQGCSVTTPTYAIINTAGNLLVSNQTVTDEVCNNNAGAINIAVSGGTTPYTFSWSNGATSEDLIGLTSGTYTVQVADNAGCTSAHSVSISDAPGTLAISNVVLTHEACVSGNPVLNQGAINISVSGGSGYTYNWSNGATTQDITALTAGDYTVTVHSGTCATSSTYTILPNGTNIAITGATVTPTVCSSNSGAVDITCSAAGPYSFNWSNGSASEDLANLNAGTYTVAVQNIYGCSVTQAYTVAADNGTLSATTLGTNETCGQQNGAIDLQISGGNSPFTYDWSNGASTQDLANLSAGTYTVQVTDHLGCLANATQSVVNNANGISIAINTVTQDQCGQNIGAIQATITGATTINWSNGATTEDLSGLAAGTYTVTATDGSGCQSTQTVTVTNQTTGWSINTIAVESETCNNGQGFIDIEVTGAGPYTYNWSNGAISQDISGLTTGTYTVTVTNGSGCSTSQSFTITNASSGTITASSEITDAHCGLNTGAVDVTTTGGISPFTYSWSNGAGTEDIANLAGGNYTLTITDGANCSADFDFVVQAVPSTLSFTANTQDDQCMFGAGSLEIVSTSNITAYEWNGMPFTGPTLFGLQGGTYQITVTDEFGCSFTDDVEIGNQSTFNLSGVTVNAACGIDNGSIDVTTSGSPGPFQYNWSNFEQTEDISNLAPGTYQIQVWDIGPNGTCGNQMTFTVASDPTIVFDPTIAVTDASCASCTDGSVNLTLGGTGYTYNWSNGATTQDLNNLGVGSYTCTINTPGGCDTIITVVVDNGLGIDDLSADNWEWNVYPNPANDVTTVSWSATGADLVSIRVLDINGKLVMQQEINGQSVVLPTDHLEPGVYFVSLKVGDQYHVKKLMVTKVK